MDDTDTKNLDNDMCIYFIKIHETLKELEDMMDKQFINYKQQINSMPEDEQKKYKKYLNIMDTIGTHYGEGDWCNYTYEGEEFGSHYLGYHTKSTQKLDCIYCQDIKNHSESKCDEFCTCCEDEQDNK